MTWPRAPFEALLSVGLTRFTRSYSRMASSKACLKTCFWKMSELLLLFFIYSAASFAWRALTTYRLSRNFGTLSSLTSKALNYSIGIPNFGVCLNSVSKWPISALCFYSSGTFYFRFNLSLNKAVSSVYYFSYAKKSSGISTVFFLKIYLTSSLVGTKYCDW